MQVHLNKLYKKQLNGAWCSRHVEMATFNLDVNETTKAKKEKRLKNNKLFGYKNFR